MVHYVVHIASGVAYDWLRLMIIDACAMQCGQSLSYTLSFSVDFSCFLIFVPSIPFFLIILSAQKFLCSSVQWHAMSFQL